MSTTETKIETTFAAVPVKVEVAPLATKAATTPATPVAAAKKVAPKLATKPVAKKLPLIAKAPVKAPAKTLVKAPAKTTIKAAVKPLAKALAKPKAEKMSKEKKPKLVRDSFTIPKAEYTVLDDLKERAGKLASSVKKSELIRAGVKALAAMSDVAFLTALKAVPTIKTGRPTKD